LQRQAELIGQGTVCAVASRRVEMTGGKGVRAVAEMASASVQGLLYARNFIGSDEYRAACEYARLHRLLWGRATAKPSGLSRVLATGLTERLEAATAAARDQMDDEAYTAWVADQRTIYERGEYRLRHIATIRMAMRTAVIDQHYPVGRVALMKVKRALRELADVWAIE
jgi:hypothetical protein